VLPAGSRLRRRADFTSTLRQSRGKRAAGLLVIHVAAPPALPSPLSPAPGNPEPPRVGFVVSRAVGPAVTRNRVRRRLRHLATQHLDRLPPGARVVVRALPRSAEATYAELDAALRRGLAVRR